MKKMMGLSILSGVVFMSLSFQAVAQQAEVKKDEKPAEISAPASEVKPGDVKADASKDLKKKKEEKVKK